MSHKPLIILSLALTLLISFDYLAAWTVPPSNPPSGNIAAPLNTANTAQSKPGLLGVSELIAANAIMVNRADVPNNTALAINGTVAASAYCDADGLNCKLTSELASLPTCLEGETLMVISGVWDCATGGNTSSSYTPVPPYQWKTSGAHLTGTQGCPQKSYGAGYFYYSQTVQCIDSTGAPIAESYCELPKPATSWTVSDCTEGSD